MSGPSNEIELLIADLNGFYNDLEPGGRLKVYTESEREQTRLNLRAVLRDAAKALASPPSSEGKLREALADLVDATKAVDEAKCLSEIWKTDERFNRAVERARSALSPNKPSPDDGREGSG